MRYLLILVLCFVGCAKNTATTLNGCQAVTSGGHKYVVCPDGSNFEVSDGTNGTNGENGSSGNNGYSAGILTQTATVDQCDTGGTQVSFYKDWNSNSSLDGDDEVTSQFLLCNGETGATGATGAAGQSSSVTVTTACAAQCATGGLVITTLNGSVSTSNVVCNGASGPVGATGPTGNQGPAGTDLNNISMVKFCSETPSYPSSFPEYGLCMNNQLWGVYSDHGGFWALLPPGTYSSNGINSSCTFTIGTNCSITR